MGANNSSNSVTTESESNDDNLNYNPYIKIRFSRRLQEKKLQELKE